MDLEAIRAWMGWFLMTLACVLAVYILLLGDTWVLPLEPDDKTASFEIVIPFLLSQITVMFRYYAKAAPRQLNAILPPFVVKGPPILATIVLIVTATFMARAGYTASSDGPSAETFRGILTFVVSFMSASTVFVVTRVFSDPMVSSPS